ncbi:IQ domain-containing protein K-like [Battus philenor]|uniref:IQ domain-containing protein K-like n=1 Tax=Battus philenor TaxID=42288 RepID=UPI0035CF9331
MTGRTTDRKGKGKEIKTIVNEFENSIATFTLPNSLSCSEVFFPAAPKRKQLAKWDDIISESERKFQEIEQYEENKQGREPATPFLNTECNYLRDQVFVYLEPALEETLRKAQIWEALKIQKCFFNGIDHIAQVLWNNNPKHPERKEHNLHIFNMAWVRNLLKENERPYYPKSWLWPEEYAATLIQKTLRQYFVQREDDVQEMRNFWKKLKLEREMPEMEANPFLCKQFASLNQGQKS